jgi:thioredoxin-related protein
MSVWTFSRRKFWAAISGGLGLAALVVSNDAAAKDSALPVPTSLPDIAARAAAKGEPLVLLITLPGCPYCEMVRRSYLLPGRKDDGLQAWQITVNDSAARLTGFDGKATSAAAQAQAWKATFTPTVLFFGPRGQELAERLVGVASQDFYGAYLDERLSSARKALLALR